MPVSLFLALLLAVFSPNVLAQDPVAFWQMDEDQWDGTSGEVTDSSGNGNNGTVRTGGSSNSFPSTTDAKVCRGGYFRGQGYVEGGAYTDAQHYVEVPDSDELSPLATTDEMSVSGWVRLDNRGGTQTIIHKGAGGQSQEYNVSFEEGRLTLTLWNRYGSATSLRLNRRVSEGQWYFFQAQASRSEVWSWGQLRWLYPVDLQVRLFNESGSVVASNSDTDWNSFNSNYTNKPLNASLIIGGTRWGGGNPTSFLNGTLDELYIHDTELTTNEARELALNTRQCSSPGSFTCEPENFDRTDLGDDWVTDSSSGSFTPQIVDGRLRMTEAVGNQATAATYQRTFPGSDNLIQVEFDYYAYDGSGADGLAVVFSDASVTPQAGGYGGSLGYAQEPDGSGGFAGGWLGIGLDEYGNFSNDSEGRYGGNNGRTLDSVAVRGAAETDYEYITDSGSLSPGIDANNDNNPFRYRITIDSRGGQTPVLTVERKRSGAGHSFSSLLTATLSGQPPMPANMLLSLTGSTGGSTNIHELDNLQICADKIGAVQELVDHFEIEHSGSGLTCSPEEITIRACDNASCSQEFPDPVEVTLSPSGWVGGDTFEFTGQTTADLQITSPGTVTLGVSGSDPGTKAFSQTLCDNGSGGLSADSCDMTFFDSGFDISIPDHVSDTTVQATIAAIKKDDVTEQCVPGFEEENKPVALWSDYVNPSSGTRNVFVDEDPVPGSLSDTSSLYFDENGEATVDVRYPDAGRVRLHARHDGEDDEEGLVMFGDGTFVARPDRFELAASVLESDGRRDNPAATDADGPVFVAAGQEFDIEVAALNASGNITPNFGREVSPEGVELGIELVKPSEGTEEPPLSGSFGDFGEDCDENAQAGVACGQFEWPEVGIITVTPSLISESYLGTEQNVIGDDLPYLGRFIPSSFAVEVFDEGELQASCGDFQFVGQPMLWPEESVPTLSITALNKEGGITKNYTANDDFMKLEGPDIAIDFPDFQTVTVDGEDTDLSVGFTQDDGEVVATSNPGEMYYEFSGNDRVWFEKEQDAKVGSFPPRLLFDVQAFEDSDEVPSGDLPDPFPTGPDEGSSGAFDIYYGRLNMENVYGPQNVEKLLMPVHVEVWNGSSWDIIDVGSCMPTNLTDIEGSDETTQDYHDLNISDFDESSASGNYYLALEPKAGSCSEGEDCTDTLEWPLSSGVNLEAGEVPEEYDWLMGFWGRDSKPDELQPPRATATFGVYRGNDRIIYWQEVLN
ncbi:MAG: DUF6701 domain-containing protein [Pseudomonadota bacterium]